MSIITGQFEAYGMGVLERITAGYPPPHTTDVLVNDRLVFDYLAAGKADNQVAVSIEPQPFGAAETEFNLPWVGTRREHEVILQFALVAIVNQVHAGIDLLILHFAKGRNIAPPPGRILADKVIGFACQFIDSTHLGIAIGAFQPHA